MTDRFEVDPKLTLDENGADLTFEGGQPVMDAGLENAALISLLSEPGWFGNAFFDDPDERVGSRFLAETRKPLSIDSVNAIRKAALADLDWIVKSSLASEVQAIVRNPEAKKIETIVIIRPPGKDIQALVLEKNGINWINQTIDPANLRV